MLNSIGERTALQLEMVTPDSGASYETEDGGDVSEQEASHQPTYYDDEDGRMSEERERNDIGQVRGPSLPAPLVWRTSKMPEDRPRFSSQQDHSRKLSSVERDRRMDGRRHSPLSKKSRFSSWARKKADGMDVYENGGSSRLMITLSDRQTLYGPLDRINTKVKKVMTTDLFSHPNLHFFRSAAQTALR